MVDDYYVAQVQDNFRQAWKLEAYHMIPMDSGYAMSLKIDRIDQLEDGRYRIIDSSTSPRSPTTCRSSRTPGLSRSSTASSTTRSNPAASTSCATTATSRRRCR